MPLLSSGGALLRNSSGALSQCAQDCCGSTFVCGGCNPAPDYLRLSFSGVTLAGCADGSEAVDQCFVASDMAIDVSGEINGEFVVAIDRRAPSGAQQCAYIGYFPGAVTVSLKHDGCDGTTYTAIAWLAIQVAWSRFGFTVSARMLVHGASVLFDNILGEGPLVFSGSGVNESEECDKSAVATNSLTDPDHPIEGGHAGWGGTCTVAPIVDGSGAGTQVAPVSCPTTCAACPTTLLAIVSGHSDPDVNGTYTLTRSGCSWSGANSATAVMTVACNFGVWLAEINGACLGSNGQTFFNESVLNSPCPPLSGWRQCRACELAGETLSISLST